MKLLFLLLVPVFGFGQSPSLKLDENGRYYFQKVIETPLTAEENYKKVKENIALLYENANWVIKLDDQEKIITKGIFDVSYNLKEYSIHHTLIIDIKDFKIRVTFNQLSVSRINMTEKAIETKPDIFYSKSFWDSMKSNSLKTMIAITDHLEKQMLKKQDDW